jgi:hypothetical protein
MGKGASKQWKAIKGSLENWLFRELIGVHGAANLHAGVNFYVSPLRLMHKD